MKTITIRAIIDSPARPGEPIVIMPIEVSDDVRAEIDKLHVRGDVVGVTIWDMEVES